MRWETPSRSCCFAVHTGLFLLVVSVLCNAQDIRGDDQHNELARLEGVVQGLSAMLDMVKQQNVHLETRIAYLETCECRQIQCYHGDRRYGNNESWRSTDGCQLCRCVGGNTECQMVGLEHCQDPCGCQNGGTCLITNEVITRCKCTAGCHGNLCEHRNNPCLFPPEPGSCHDDVTNFFYDTMEQRCRPFSYSGCGGNPNRFDGLELCENSCVYGACCYIKLTAGEVQNFCEVLDMSSCRRLGSSDEEKVMVQSFRPGVSCQEESCPVQVADGCVLGNTTYSLGEQFKMGCDLCTCELDGSVVCSCERTSVRKEIRDMSPEEVLRFQQAILQLKMRSDQWDHIRDMYSQHITLANHWSIFLPWHRAFLQYVERKLQETDCSVTIPYFDFTSDSGTLSEALIWQANYFGGNGGELYQCVTHHPFGAVDSWLPCIQRNFNPNISLPTMLHVAEAVNNPNYVEMSRSLQTIVAYLHIFTGGTLLSSNAAYDPIFLPFHAFVDMLFSKWQDMHRYSRSPYPREYWDLPMPPYFFTPNDVMDSEALCVTYAPQSEGADCNVTQEPFDLKSKYFDYYRAGYDEDGFDSIGYNIFGFNRQGFNRDGYDMAGFDEDGFDRLGFDLEGFNRWGYNRQGMDRTGALDETLVYHLDSEDWKCLTREGYSPEGFDQYGFDRQGYNSDNCKSFYHGPFSPLQLKRLWDVALSGNKTFMTSLPVICIPIQPLPDTWALHSATTKQKDITGSTPHVTPPDTKSLWSQRFCFDTSMFLTNCLCEDQGGFMPCASNPCNVAACPQWPRARCLVDLCTCQPLWVEDGVQRECEDVPEVFDLCMVNPCGDGGTCSTSPVDPSIFHCVCPPGWFGPFCQHEASAIEICSMPMVTGNCSEQHQRWFYNPLEHTCQQFEYTGCQGNSNNFANHESCLEKCVMGACCYRVHDPQAPTKCPNSTSYSQDPAHIYRHECIQTSNYLECLRLHDHKAGSYVVSFKLNTTCEEARCDDSGVCGCMYHGLQRDPGESFMAGCSLCTCTEAGSVNCDCSQVSMRKSLHDLTSEEWGAYHEALHKLTVGYPSKWQRYAQMYQERRPQALGVSFLPWHRFFLRMIEQELQASSCEVTIPYFDWTIDVGKLNSSKAWQASSFGGNGVYPESCVPFNPFQDFMKPWTPCLTRSFNTSLFLPDAVNIRMILSEDSFEDFSSQLEIASALFHLYVGGHMATDMAAYDPIFLSHIAYLDKLWHQWQTLHPNVSYSEAHDVLMAPFDISLSDVLSSEVQMCVTYSDVTQGVPCTLPVTSATDYDDFPDENLNPHGYNQKGYDRLGYDSSGYNEFGFNKDTYNRDGYDPIGYDRSGYDRHGFDKNGYTPFDFHRNGSSLNNQTAWKEHFDKSGYNRYGFNQYGYDREGYNPFGFNNLGVDTDGCNYFRMGPHYLQNKAWADQQLGELKGANLASIKRICEPVSSLPEWWYRSWKESRRDGGNLSRIDWVHKWNELHKADIPENRRISSVTDEGLWLPVTTDYRFCFQLHQNSKCPFGQQPITCDQELCANLHCPEQPLAVCRVIGCGEKCDVRWFDAVSGQIVQCAGCVDVNGTIREEQTVWRVNACRVCACQFGEITCRDTTCPPLTCSHPVRPENECCSNCEGCLYWGQIYEEQTWFPHPHEPCQKCYCTQGNVTCRPEYCPRLFGCKKSVKLEDQCCPVCQDDDCGRYENGNQWNEDPCTRCTCVDGKKECQTTTCPDVECSHPLRRKSECCPTCTDCLYEGRRRKNGDKWQADRCRTCRCLQGSAKCITKSCPPVFCARPTTPPGECCPRCTEAACEYDGVIYKHGAFFTAKYNKCLNCSCESGLVRCSTIQCPDTSHLTCQQPLIKPGECCPSYCPGCLHNGVEYIDGDTWTPTDDECQQCSCYHGTVSCDTQACDQVTCRHGSHVDGTCCRTCEGCFYEGREVRDGERFSLQGDLCRECLCIEGNVRCREITQCPALNCPTQERSPGACCPVCTRGNETMPDSCVDSEGVPRPDGSKWRDVRDHCSICQCVQFRVTCEPMACSPRCTHPIPPRDRYCCPSCSGCLYDDHEYQEGETVQSLNSCENCNCTKGSVKCKPVDCPNLQCHNPVELEDDSCCPVCPSCVYQEETFENGTSFAAPRNPCQICSCVNGKVDCVSIEEDCQPHCPHPAKVYGQCCPICTDCVYQRRRFHNGQQFHLPDALCEICGCNDGRVTCQTKTCPPLDCVDPQDLPGHCCPVCPQVSWTPTSSHPATQSTTPIAIPTPPTISPDILEQNVAYNCSLRGLLVADGEIFTSPSDPCKECICQKGEVQCRDLLCPSTDCVEPSIPEGECCPVCPRGCRYLEQQLRDGETFTPVTDPCQICTCQNGRVDCQTKLCKVVHCSTGSPVTRPGHCCPACPQTCRYHGNTYQESQMFVHPVDRCQSCLCENGRITCQPKVCQQLDCTEPQIVHGQCCPSCPKQCHDGQGESFDDGEVFISSKTPCQQCLCQQGHINCSHVPCDDVQCERPAVPAGECCPVCPVVCIYENTEYHEGEVFDSVTNRCEECQCKNGEIQCRKKNCSRVKCRHPYLPQDACCPRCKECYFKRKTFENGQTFPHPKQPCQECNCKDGTAQCSAVQCTPVTCSRPKRIQGQCCPVCETIQCEQGGEVYKLGQNFPHPEHPCQACTCQDNGEIQCVQVECPAVECDHPIQEACCLSCNGCFYSGQEYRNMETLISPHHPCKDCRCMSGSVKCLKKACPYQNCAHPTPTPPDQCCVECKDCQYDGVHYQDQEQFPLSSDSCTQCVCSKGTVTCQRGPCPAVLCTHPAKGDCCLTCDDCIHHSQVYKNGQNFVNILNVCEDCNCDQGNVTCKPVMCPDVTCSHPIQGHCCPECTDCLYDGRRMQDGKSFQDPSDLCQICQCFRGSVRCKRRECPVVNCVNPIRGPCCSTCPEGCSYYAVHLKEGETIPHRVNPCKECVCQNRETRCYKKKCPDPQCSHPYVDDCGCASCAHCLIAGKVIGQGQRVTSSDDPCEMCDCQDGNVHCDRVQCPATNCHHPIYSPDSCCPQCVDCEHKGRHHKNGTQFLHPNNPCKLCHCLNGAVRCTKTTCPADPGCSHPVPGTCCPRCDGCKHHGQVYNNGQRFRTDPCNECVCQAGNVRCEDVVCPKLTCPRPKNVPGVCCKTCGGCLHDGAEHPLGSTWVLAENPCITCRCENGITFCEETECRAPCEHPVSLSGVCCPVCPSCHYNGVEYLEGESFSPTDDPCDTCVCQNDNMVCKKQNCVSEMLCSEGSYLPPSEGQCCPLCAQARSQCTVDKIGVVVRSKENPCNTCQCKDEYNWFCMREMCPPLLCDPEDQLVAHGDCCPYCTSCVVPEENDMIQDGTTWTSRTDPCFTCLCQDGQLNCTREQCRSLVCDEGYDIQKLENQCCAGCVSLLMLSCEYDGKTLQPGEEVSVDECTRCVCKDATVECHTQTCIQPDCAADEIPSLLPGVCCPVCLPEPATCVAFGDPHYRTLDGALINFQGMCRYVMVADCNTGHFVVEAEHDDRGTGLVSWVRSLTLKLTKHTVDLLQGGEVKVNGQTVALPFLLRPELYVEQKESTVLLSTYLGLRIQWNGDSYVEISVPGTYKSATCGLCGNFNNFPQDDMRLKSGVIVSSAATFGNSWQVGDAQCAKAKDSDPCAGAGYRIRKMANTKCAVLKKDLFRKCHRVIAPEQYFASCVYDLCACDDAEACLCDILSTYALECAKAGVTLAWRSRSLCAIGCPKERGFMFDECGPPCPRTCADADVPMGEIEPRCMKPCVPGCQCPAHLVLHRDRCIPKENCP